MNPPKAPIITPVERVLVTLDELSLPATPPNIPENMTSNNQENLEVISETVDNIIETIETENFLENAQWRTTGRTISSLSDDYGTFAGGKKEDKCCPTCGVHSAWHNVDYSHRICVPTIGPAKPQRFDSFGGVSLRFNVDIMSEAEKVASGGNIFRCQTVCTSNCALCMQPCQEQGPSAWKQFTGWDWCHANCWVDLCWRYHTEYLEPNGHVNTLGRFLVFLEE